MEQSNEDLELNEVEGEEGEENEGIAEEASTAKPKKLTPDQVKGIKQRQLTKLAKELGVDLTKPEKVENQSTDYAKLAFLEAKSVPEDDFDFVLEEAKKTGKELKELLGYKYMKEELESRKESRRAKEAMPTGSKRSGVAVRDTVEYHLNRESKLSEITDPKLRREVWKARSLAAKSPFKFSQ